MKKQVIAIYDTELEYTEHLMNYFNQKRKANLEIRIFTNQKALLKFITDNIIDILLIAEGLMFELLDIQKIKKIFFLSEENLIKEETNNYIYKFQSAEQIWKQLSIYIEETYVSSDNSYQNVSKETNLIGIFSPCGGSEKSNFSLAIGQKIAERQKTLYINMEAFPGTEDFPREEKRGLSEIIYNIHEQKEWISQISSMIYSEKKLDCIFSVNHFCDLLEIKASDIQVLKEGFSKDYRTILLDIDYVSEEVFDILELCEKIYMPIKKDEISERKKRNLFQYLKMQEKEELFQYFIPIIIIDNKSITEDFIEEIVKKEFL